MSVSRVYRVKSSRQRFQMVSTGEVNEVTVRGKVQRRRVKVADKTQPLPNYKCSNCGTEIQVGMPYIYWEPGFRSSYKVVRCNESKCYPRTSELETTKTAAIYAAIESVGDQIGDVDSIDGLNELVEEVKTAIEEVKDEYGEAKYGADGSTVFNTMAEEKEAELEDAIGELDGFSFGDEDEDQSCEEHDEFEEGCVDCHQAKDDWLQERRDEVLEAINSVSF